MFIIGSGFFGLGTFFAGLGYQFVDYQTPLWAITTSLLVFAPIGYFLSARRIITGLSIFKDIFSAVVTVIFAVVSVLILIVYGFFTGSQNIVLWDPFIALGLIIASLQFFTIYRISPPDLRKKLIICPPLPLFLLNFLLKMKRMVSI